MAFDSVTVLKLVENDQAILFEEVASEWNPHTDLQDPVSGPNAIGEEFGAGTYYLLDNNPDSRDAHEIHEHLLHPAYDDLHGEFNYLFRIVEEDVTTTVSYSYHV